MAKSFNWWMRKLHRWGAVLIAIPLLIVIVSGLLLQVKKQITWVQPATQRGSASQPELQWDSIIASCRSVKEAQVDGWQDVDRIDVRVDKGVMKVQCKNGWELQLDSVTGEVLSSEYRRSDLIENLHDGSFFSDPAKLWIFLPNGIVLLALWFTGLYLWYLPFGAKRKKKTGKTKQESTD